MTNSQQKIITYLRTHPSASSEEISQALLLSIPNTRHHLRQLVKNGTLVLRPSHEMVNRGRPILHYSVSEHYSENNFAGLANALLEMVSTCQSAPEPEISMRSLSIFLVSSPPDSPPASIKRLNQTVARLNQMHYQARWEARSTGPWMLLGPCPYSAILSGQPQLCEMDKYLLERLCGAPVNQLQRQKFPLRGACNCIFSVVTPTSKLAA